MIPKKIKVENNLFLIIDWDNDVQSKIKLSNLRINCPCAICNAEKDERSSSYIPIFSDEQLKINDIKIIGSYALGITWKDGHNTGIYEFEHLRSLSK